MILYKITARTSLHIEEKDFYSRQNLIYEKNIQYSNIYTTDKKYKIMITDILDGEIILTVAVKYEVAISDCVKFILNSIPDISTVKSRELTIAEYEREISRAYSNNWTERSADFICRELGLRIKPSRYSFEESAYMVREHVFSAKSQKSTYKKIADILASDSFYDEIERIYAKENLKKFFGHPVHYYITAGDKGAADDMIAVLVPALLKNKRLLSGRVCYIENMSSKAYQEEGFGNIFLSSQGATVVIKLHHNESNSQYATGYHMLAEKLGEQLRKYGNNTLFIFVDVGEKRSMSNDTIATILANADMVHITEGCGDFQQAAQYLKRLAEKTPYKNYTLDELTQYLPSNRGIFSVSDIFNAYHRWYGKGLKTHVYKAYKEKDIVKIDLKKKTDKPYEELQHLIGLSDAKKVTDEILALAKLKKMRKEMGLSVTNASMHMLFSGSPGTAKTTVARLLAQILKQEEVLANGHIVECGRQNLVGKYVGWTAKIVEDKFRAARGGILFIDEAYSLVEDGRTYGAEAINVIVQLMENYREETIVIFAGYPEKMKSFLEQNEGLASRIAFHLNFLDYTPDELLSIMELMLQKQGYNTDEFVLKKCHSIFSEACKTENFGNGRFVRNLVEHAIMRQADRLLHNNTKELTKDEVSTLIAEDFEMIGMKKNKIDNRIGF